MRTDRPVLVTGAGGQVGHELAAVFGDRAVALDRAALDVVDREAVVAAVDEHHPQVVVHAAAWTAVDACEEDPDRALLVNGAGARHVAEAARAVGARTVYISTDYVFDGTKSDPYVEDDPVNPQSAYGRSKLAGEGAMDDDDTIVRTSWVCGRHGANMVKTILRLAGEHPQLSFVDDQRGHPTFAADLAQVIGALVDGEHRGVFHVTNQGAVSWYEFAREVLRAAGDDPERVTPISTAALDPPRPAPRPTNSVLENRELGRRELDLAPDFREPLRRLVAQLTE